jgi:hypothetical protein
MIYYTRRHNSEDKRSVFRITDMAKCLETSHTAYTLGGSFVLIRRHTVSSPQEKILTEEPLKLIFLYWQYGHGVCEWKCSE